MKRNRYKLPSANCHMKNRKYGTWDSVHHKLSLGFTLIELLLYMGIFSILLMVLVELFGTIVNVNLSSQTTSALSEDGRFIMNRMTYDIREATTISQPATLGSPGSSTLQFTKSDGKTYTYSLVAGQNGNNLVLSDGTFSDQINSYGTSVPSITFMLLKTTGTSGKETVLISFPLKSNIRDQAGYQEENFETSIGIR